jgi:hypothetical protein
MTPRHWERRWKGPRREGGQAERQQQQQQQQQGRWKSAGVHRVPLPFRRLG